MLLLINRSYGDLILVVSEGLVTYSFDTFINLVDGDALLIEVLFLSFHSNICHFETLLCEPVIGQEIFNLTLISK